MSLMMAQVCFSRIIFLIRDVKIYIEAMFQ